MSEPARPQRLIFGEVAETYDRVRPEPADALLDEVAGLTGLAAGAGVLETGAGTGKGTAALVRQGWRLTCLEPDAQMAALLRRNTAGADVTVVEGDFEHWDGPRGAFDALAAVDSWHWLDRAVAAGKAADHLRPGGWLLVLWNRTDLDATALSEQLHAQYARHAPALLAYARERAASLHPNDEVRAELAASGRYGEPVELRHRWTATYTTEEYVALMSTYSGHRRLDADSRDRLHAAIAEVIDGDGGTYAVPYHAIALATPRR